MADDYDVELESTGHQAPEGRRNRVTRLALVICASLMLYYAASEYSAVMALAGVSLAFGSVVLSDATLKKLMQTFALHIGFAILAPKQFDAYLTFRRGQFWASLLGA